MKKCLILISVFTLLSLTFVSCASSTRKVASSDKELALEKQQAAQAKFQRLAPPAY